MDGDDSRFPFGNDRQKGKGKDEKSKGKDETSKGNNEN
jgi:hypothetical protein